MYATEKVIIDLNEAKHILCHPQMLTPDMYVRIGKAITSAIALLKEREPKPITITTNEYGTRFYHCPNCNKPFYEPWELYKDYCYNCGQALRWE